MDSGICSNTEFQSTPPVWGATKVTNIMADGSICISIHAPRVGGDGSLGRGLLRLALISIHAPRVGGDGPR